LEASRIVRRGRRRWLLWVAVVAVLAAVALSILSGFYIDILWFREVHLSSVFWTVFWTRLGLAVAFGLLFFALLYANLLIARRLRPRYRVYSAEEEYVERYRVAFEPYARWVLPAVALVFALFSATGVSTQWEAFRLWRVSGEVSFGVPDPVFQRDVAFYVLSLPFQRFVQSWLFSSLVVVTLVTAAAHYLWGGIRYRAVGERVTPQVKAHLSVLLGVVLLVRAWGYRLGQFELLISPRGTVTGASYTDIHAQLPALTVLLFIALFCAVLFLVNIRFRGWALPVFAIGILALASIVIGGLFPAFVQRFRVDPQELQLEAQFIDRNIKFTRQAYDIEDVETVSFTAAPEVTAEEIEDNARVVENIRLWNPDVLKQSYLQLQRIRPYYEFVDVDVDRYEVEGRRRVVMVAPREITQDGIRGGGQTWQNRHLTFTHGYGLVASRADQASRDGAPALVASDIPPQGDLATDLRQPRVYFAEITDVPFVVVRTDQPEFDFPTTESGEEQFARTAYEGRGGIQVGGFIRRLAFAWRFRDVNLLISGLINGESRMLINTEIGQRVRRLAPFLQYDHDPYTAMVDGRLVWIWDAYTVSANYPYSERIDLASVASPSVTTGLPSLQGDANYIRNSVKVTIDAYDGTTTFYVVDPEDPIIQAWQRVFPDLFTPVSEASPRLREHFRYPEDLFKIQATQFANYHVTSANQFYAKEDFWQIPVLSKDPTERTPQPLEPYYVLLTLPGEEEEQFMIILPMTPAERPNMVAWLAAVSDPEEYGRMVAFRFPVERNVNGPGQVAALISQDPDVSREVSLFGQIGSRVIYGDLLTIPIGQGFLFVQPLYLRSQQEATSIPELKRVIAVNGQQVAYAETLDLALAQIFGETVPPEQPPVEPTQPTGTVAQLLAEARQHFERAEELLRQGDLAGYQREIEAAQRAVQQALEELRGGGGAEATPSPSPTG
jgi:uncharacterized membrane protein (UPF0182 family)